MHTSEYKPNFWIAGFSNGNRYLIHNGKPIAASIFGCNYAKYGHKLEYYSSTIEQWLRTSKYEGIEVEFMQMGLDYDYAEFNNKIDKFY